MADPFFLSLPVAMTRSTLTSPEKHSRTLLRGDIATVLMTISFLTVDFLLSTMAVLSQVSAFSPPPPPLPFGSKLMLSTCVRSAQHLVTRACHSTAVQQLLLGRCQGRSSCHYLPLRILGTPRSLAIQVCSVKTFSRHAIPAPSLTVLLLHNRLVDEEITRRHPHALFPQVGC